MAQTTSGKVLREARERKGYDLNTVARRLRIRPDILRAIEAGDYNAMPPRGYTRNMVNAYAKLLGLNPTEIVNMYLDEAYAQQVEKARGSAPRSGFNMQRETRRSRSQLGVGENSGAETRAIHPIPSDDGGTRQFTRVLYDDGTRFSRDDYGVTRERTERPGKSERDFLSHHSGYDATTHGSYTQSPQRGNRNIYAGQTPMQYSASRLPGFLQSRAVLLAIGIAIVAIVIVVLVVVLGGRNNAQQEDVSTLPVSGISDTTGTDQASASAAAVDVAPTSARVIYSVKSGEECYVEIYSGTSMTPENLTGPTEKTVDVTDVWTIATWSPETIKVTVDGQEIELKANSKYGGMYSYTVDFPEILKQWQQTHNASGSAASASSANGSTASTNAAAAAGAAAAGAAAAASSTDDGTNYDESADPTRGLESQSDTTEDESVEEEEPEEEYYEEPAEEYYDDGTYDDGTYDEGAYYEEEAQ